MSREIRHVCIALSLAIILLVANMTASAAAGEPITDPGVELVYGPTNYPVTNKQIREKLKRVIQPQTGAAAIEIKEDQAASSPSAPLDVDPAGLEIWIVPPLPGVTFSLNGRLFTSDENGVARIQVSRTGTYRLKVVTVEVAKPDIRARFIRWGDEVFVPDRDIKVPRRKPLRVGFEVSYQAGPVFVDLSQQSVDRTRITSMELRASDGQFYRFEDTEPKWLLANSIVDRQHGIEESKVLYSVMNITMDGSNVINAAQQRFYLGPNEVWPIELLLYSARFTARDALFRFPVGSGIRLEYPNGNSQEFPFGAGRELKVEALARGPYLVTVVGVKGIAPVTPIALSRGQDIELLVVSYFDVAVVFVLMTSLALGLLFFGRPEFIATLITLPGHLFPTRRTGRLEGLSILANPDTAVLRQCPSCQATIKQSQGGLSRSGRQRYLCYACGQIYTPTPYPIGGYSPEIKMRALQLYLEGNSRRSIGRILKISPQTVSNWITDHTIKLPPVPVSGSLAVAVTDEQFAEIT